MAQNAEVRPAATVLLVRDEPTFQVLMVKRHHQIDFAGGALVFPGGKLDPGDYDNAWGEIAIGWETLDPGERPVRIAAIREAYEEAGVLIGQSSAREPFRGDLAAMEARQAVATGKRAFIDVFKSLDLRPDLTALTQFARWVTPAGMPKRFDTWFYVVRNNPEQTAICDGWETVDAEWIGPQEALDLAARGERTIIFPTRMNLKLLAESVTCLDAIRHARQRDVVTVLPTVQKTSGGLMLTIPEEAGYGVVVEAIQR